MPTTVTVTEQKFSPTKSQPVFLDSPCCVVQQCNMQSSEIYMTPVEEINQCPIDHGVFSVTQTCTLVRNPLLQNKLEFHRTHTL